MSAMQRAVNAFRARLRAAHAHQCARVLRRLPRRCDSVAACNSERFRLCEAMNCCHRSMPCVRLPQRQCAAALRARNADRRRRAIPCQKTAAMRIFPRMRTFMANARIADALSVSNRKVVARMLPTCAITQSRTLSRHVTKYSAVL